MKKRVIAILTALIILTILFIFSNSLRPVKQSLGQSSRVVDIIVKVFKIDDNVNMELFHRFVRKAAHFTEYSILGAEIFLLVYEIERKYFGRLTFIPIVAVFETACIDEYIQSFSDRGDSIKDVLLDFSGGVCGIFFTVLMIFIIRKIAYKIKHKKPKKHRKK